jgi:hypothetical protein
MNPAEIGLKRILLQGTNQELANGQRVSQLDVRKAMNSANRLFLTGAILSLKMAF